jgi:mono/diheme cytochrome c family protein
MAEVVEKSTSLLSETDLRAIAVYITGRAGSDRTLPAPLASTDMAWVNGRDLFQRHCAACHGSSGEGVHAMVPRLARVSGIVAPDPASLIRTVLSGGQKGTRMPGFAGRLDDGQIADILTYIRNDWGNAATRSPPRGHIVPRWRSGMTSRKDACQCA